MSQGWLAFLYAWFVYVIVLQINNKGSDAFLCSREVYFDFVISLIEDRRQTGRVYNS